MKIDTMIKIMWFSIGVVCLGAMWRCIHAL